MIDQISFSIVFIFIVIISICVLILIFVSPKAISEYKNSIRISSKSNMIDSINNKALTSLFDELSQSTDKVRIREICSKLKDGAERLQSEAHNPAQKQHADTIVSWLQYFSIPDHIKDLKTKKFSRQIQFTSNKNFKLLILDHNKKTPQ